MQTVKLIQGSADWHTHRARHFNASDAPAMMSESPYTKRSELVKRLATGITPDVDTHTQRIFDSGHRYEALARPLAEEIIGEELFPSTGAEGKFSASFDGLTMCEDMAFEHKTLNASLRQAMQDGCTGADLPLHYQIQMEHQALVSGCDRILFMASEWTGDGALIEERHCWYTPNPELHAQIVAGWEQLEKDVAAYVPETPDRTVTKVHDALPMLRIDARGEITESNLEEFKAVVMERISSINTELETDQQFADAEVDAKWLRGVASAAKQAGEMVIGNMVTVQEVISVLKHIENASTEKAKDIERDVDAEKKARKENIALKGHADLCEHISAVNAQMGANYIPQPARNFFEPVTKGLKSLKSMEDKVRAALAQAIGDANATALRLRTNRDHLKQDDQDWITLFSDFGVVGTRAAEDFQALAAHRIGQHKAAEQARLDAAREKIRTEEQAKADAAMRAELIRLEQEAQAGIEDARKAESLPAPLLDALSDTAAFVRADAVAEIDTRSVINTARRPAAPVDEGNRITLGQIKDRIAPLSIDAAGLAQLGFQHVATDKSAKLYRECDFPAMRAAMVRHLQGIGEAMQLAA